MASQVIRIVQEKPRIDMKPKFRCGHRVSALFLDVNDSQRLKHETYFEDLFLSHARQLVVVDMMAMATLLGLCDFRLHYIGTVTTLNIGSNGGNIAHQVRDGATMRLGHCSGIVTPV